MKSFLSKLSKLWSFFAEDSQANLSKKFDFLDGYRGFCALIVVLHHMTQYFGIKGDFLVLRNTGFYFGVVGFFVLSSFLLTYKMLSDFYRIDEKCLRTSLSKMSVIIRNFFIRRFFRIYIPYVVYVTLCKFGPEIFCGNYRRKYYNQWLQLILLQPVGKNHLWTSKA
jgi:peptidoglycan/LPS O-acetylase OafA/YrhL